MIEHLWSILCQNCLVEKNTNTISLIEVVEDLGISGKLPTEGEQGVIPIQCNLVSSWERRPSNQPIKGTVRLRTIRPNGECEKEQEYTVDLSNHQRGRTIAKMSGIGFRELGRHVFELQLKEDGSDAWRHVASIPISINMQASKDSN